MITKDNLTDNEAATRIRLEIEKLTSSYKALRDSKTEKGSAGAGNQGDG